MGAVQRPMQEEQFGTCTVPETAYLCADAARLHDILEQLEPVSVRRGLSEAAGMSDLIRQHKEVQQQIAEAKQRAAKLQLVADVEKQQAHFEACLSAGDRNYHNVFRSVVLQCSKPLRPSNNAVVNSTQFAVFQAVQPTFRGSNDATHNSTQSFPTASIVHETAGYIKLQLQTGETLSRQLITHSCISCQ